MKIFIPPLDTIWCMIAPWAAPQLVFDRDANAETIHGEKGYYFDQFRADTGIETTGQDWVPKFREWEKAKREKRGVPEFLTGTVVSFERYHMSRSGEDQVTLRVLASPHPMLNPKKQGGKMRGMGRLYLSLEEINTFPELEQVHDFVA